MSTNFLPPAVTREKAIAALVAAFPTGEANRASYLSTKSDEYLSVRLDLLLDGLQPPVGSTGQMRFDTADDPQPIVPTPEQRRALAVLQGGDR